MKETLRHKEAFEHYYALGPARTLPKVALKVGVSPATAKDWSREFGWQKRIKERDAKNAKVLAERTDKVVISEKAIHRRDIRDSLTLVKAALATAVERLRSGKLRADSPADIAMLVNAQEKLIKADQLLAGEADSREEHVIVIKYVDAKGEQI